MKHSTLAWKKSFMDFDKSHKLYEACGLNNKHDSNKKGMGSDQPQKG
jgi:hypothetical protein